MTQYPGNLAVAGIVVLLLSFSATAQTIPNRALSGPRTTDGANPYYPPAGYPPAGSAPNLPGRPGHTLDVPGAAENFAAACSASLAKAKELNTLLKKKIALLEQRLALAEEPRK